MMILLFNAKVAFSCGNNALKVSRWRKGATMLNCVYNSIAVNHSFFPQRELYEPSVKHLIVLRLIWLLAVTRGHKNVFIYV